MTPAAVIAAYRRHAPGAAETIFIRRYAGAGANRPRFDVSVTARVTGYAPQDLVGGIQQGDRKIILLADDLAAAQLALPITAQDKAVVRGRELAIIAPDDSTRRVQGVLVAVELQVRG